MGVVLEYSDKRSEEYSDKRSEELKFYIQSSSDKSTQTRGVRSIGAQLQNMVASGQKIVMRGPGCTEG